MPIKIVHCADVHIGASFSHLPSNLSAIRAEEVKSSFSDIINYCKEKSVDALLICGDLFDCPNPLKKDCDFVRKALSSLSPIPVFIICGNHDYMCPDSPFLKEGYFSDNVHIFPSFDYSFAIPKKNTVIYGKSYTSSVTEPTFTDIPFDESKINIMCLHGDTTPGSDYNTISHKTLSSLPCNYAAFGHIHSGEIFKAGNIDCAYSGMPEASSFGDDGFTGFIYAEISENETSVLPVSLSKRHYRNISYDISGKSLDNITSSLKKLLNKDDLFRITFVGECREDINLKFLKEDLENFAFYIDITDSSTPAYDFDAIENEESLRGEFLRELRMLSTSEEDFILAAKTGLDALSGKVPCAEVEI